MRAIGGISSPCEIVYDQWYKNRQKSVSFSGHISDGLSVVSVRAEPHKGYVTESVELSGIMPKPGSEGHGKSGHLSDRLRRKAPRRYFTLASLVFVQLTNQLYE